MVKMRILSLFLVLIVLVSLAVPVFAWGDSSEQEFAVIPFDSVSNGAGLSDSYPGNTMSEGDFGVDGTYFGFFSSYYSSNPLQYTEIFGPGSNQIVFTARDFVVQVNTLDGAALYAGLDDTFAVQAVLICTILTYELDGDHWVLTPITFQSTYNGESFNFGRILKDAIKYRVDELSVLISYLSISVTVADPDFDGNWDLRMPMWPTYAGIRPWGNQFDLTSQPVILDPSDPADVSFVDWLKVGVGGFLEFELWPGMALNQLIEFVLVFALVFWLITLLI